MLLLEPLTGASVNPARAFGSDILAFSFGVSVKWLDVLVAYTVGPIVGALVAVVLYDAIATARSVGKPPMHHAA